MNNMESLRINPKQQLAGDVENWDDDDDLQGIDDFQFRNVSSTTVGSTPHHRESISSRLSIRSDLESVGGGDEDWQMLLPTEDDKSRADAINSAKSAGIPIPQSVPTSALIGGTIKRMGGRQVKKILGEDWGEDIQLPKPEDGGLKLKKSERNFPESLRGFSAEFPMSSSPSNPIHSNKSFMERMTAATRGMPDTAASLHKFRDDKDDSFFGDVPTLKIAKNRGTQKSSEPLQPSAISATEADNLEDDLELPADGQPLKLSARREAPKTPASQLNDDLDMEWAEGSLGTRFGGTRRENRSNPSSSISAFSPSASSVLTGESEDEGLEGLVLPDGPIKFGEVLKKRLENVTLELSEKVDEKSIGKTSAEDANRGKDDFFSGIELGDGEVFDSGKLTLNRNIIRKANRQTSPVRRPATTLTFTNKIEQGISKIPRPQHQDRPPRSTLESVSETGGAVPHYRRPGSRLGGHSAQSSLSAIPNPATPSSQNTAPSTPSRRVPNTKSSRDALRSEPTLNASQLLKAKRSMPVMGRNQASPARHQQSSQRPLSRGGEPGGSRQALPTRPKTPVDRYGADSGMTNTRKPPLPFLPAGTSHAQSHHISAKSSRTFNRPNSSDSNENAPTNRPLSRLSNNLFRPTTPTRRDHAPESLTREAASKRTLTKPTRRRAFGVGNELDAFDDLPTSASTESRFTKQPIARGAPKSMQIRNKLGLEQNNASSTSIDTEAALPKTPSTPLNPVKHDPLPRFARDTNASRLAREQRIGSVSAALHATPSLPAIREAGGPLCSISTNFKAPTHVSHKSLTSPMSHSKKRSKAPHQKPRLIKPMGEGVNSARSVKGMYWNPAVFRWEGNENLLAPFDVAAPSPADLASPNKSPGGTKAAPALIANVGAPKGVQMSGGMVFDPQRMCWLKAAPHLTTRGDSNPLSPSTIDEDEDPFAGLDDLDDAPKGSVRKGVSMGGHTSESFGGSLGCASNVTGAGQILLDEEECLVGEEFDVGPDYVRRQRAEEERWRAKVEGWVGDGVVRDHPGSMKDVWKWAIREKALKT